MPNEDSDLVQLAELIRQYVNLPNEKRIQAEPELLFALLTVCSWLAEKQCR